MAAAAHGAAVHDRAAAGFALLTGAMIATYTALDRVGVQLAPAWLYAGILWPVCAIGLGLVWLVRPRDSPAAGTPRRRTCRRRAACGARGLLTFIAYGLVLCALSPCAARDRGAAARVRRGADLHVGRASCWARRSAGARCGARLAGPVLVLAGAAVLALSGVRAPTTPWFDTIARCVRHH